MLLTIINNTTIVKLELNSEYKIYSEEYKDFKR